MVDIEINLSDEGGRINWVDQVEEENPPGWSTYEVKQKKPARVRKEVKEVRIRKEPSYPYYMDVGSYLAMKLGKRGMKEVGVRNEKQLEEMYMAVITREPGVCKSPQWSQFKSFEVEKLGEAALQRLIRGWESGMKVVDVGEGGRTRPCVVMHAMSPHSSHIIIPATTKEQTNQDAGRDQIEGVDKEVNNL